MYALYCLYILQVCLNHGFVLLVFNFEFVHNIAVVPTFLLVGCQSVLICVIWLPVSVICVIWLPVSVICVIWLPFSVIWLPVSVIWC